MYSCTVVCLSPYRTMLICGSVVMFVFSPACLSSCSHPSPAELAEMLSELRRVEERLQPFIQRAHSILETATTAEYNNNTVGFKQTDNSPSGFVYISNCFV